MKRINHRNTMRRTFHLFTAATALLVAALTPSCQQIPPIFGGPTAEERAIVINDRLAKMAACVLQFHEVDKLQKKKMPSLRSGVTKDQMVDQLGGLAYSACAAYQDHLAALASDYRSSEVLPAIEALPQSTPTEVGIKSMISDHYALARQKKAPVMTKIEADFLSITKAKTKKKS
jgi:hypothetical protein